MPTKISWTDEVWNPVTGCTKVSEGCRNCYASTLANRFWKDRKFEEVKTHPERLLLPFHWKRPRRIFVNSMSDLFHKNVPSWYVNSVFDVMIRANWHIYQVLTKRPDRMSNALRGMQFGSHIWLGVTMEDQRRADERGKIFRSVGPAIRFLSLEPMLESIEIPFIEKWNWVIVGRLS